MAIRKAVAKSLEEHKHDLKIWDLAGDGWRKVASDHRDAVIAQEIATFNTPKPHNVNSLFKKLFGIEKLSDNWKWKRMSASASYRKLSEFVKTRGTIAHGGKLVRSITKTYVDTHRDFVLRLAVCTANVIREKVIEEVGSSPWRKASIGKSR